MNNTENTLKAYQSECREVEQVLGNVLGYPWFKDDLKNFPDATESDGVCVGEHCAGTIAQEAAELISRLRIALADAIRRPMGIVPDSAMNLVSNDELDAAEKRRISDGKWPY